MPDAVSTFIKFGNGGKQNAAQWDVPFIYSYRIIFCELHIARTQRPSAFFSKKSIRGILLQDGIAQVKIFIQKIFDGFHREVRFGWHHFISGDILADAAVRMSVSAVEGEV